MSAEPPPGLPRHIYRLYQGNVSWDTAYAYVESLGDNWQLACIDNDSENEQRIIEDLVDSFNYACWLGGNDLEGKWRWLSGIEIDLSDPRWDTGEPSSTNSQNNPEHYLGIYANDTQTRYSTKNKWNDFQLNSTTPKGFVAEYTPDASIISFEPDFFIPNSIQSIKSQAFMGINAKCIMLPENITEIGELSFAHCQNLQGIFIPAACLSIASNAFEGDEGLVIWGVIDSYAESYAEQKGFDFLPLQ